MLISTNPYAYSQLVQSSEECIIELMTKLSIPTKKGLKPTEKTPRPGSQG